MTTCVLVGEGPSEPLPRHGGRFPRFCQGGPGTKLPGLVLVVAALGSGGSWAEPGPGDAELAATGVGGGELLQAARTAWEAPREAQQGLILEPPALSLSVSRADPAYRFRGSESNELQGVSYRWWLGSGRAAVGFGLGSIGYVVQLPAARDTAATTVVGSVPTASIGLRFALSPTAQAYADGSRTTGLAGQDDVFYNAKAGIEWKPVKSRFGFEGGRFGVQLDSGYRVSFRTRKGGLSIYLRRTF